MTPVAFLAGFCGTLFAVAAVRLARADRFDPVDAGTTLIVGGLTGLAVTWAFADAGSQLAIAHWAFAALAIAAILVGIAAVVRFM